MGVPDLQRARSPEAQDPSPDASARRPALCFTLQEAGAAHAAWKVLGSSLRRQRPAPTRTPGRYRFAHNSNAQAPLNLQKAAVLIIFYGPP